jgi:hypothetical protein
MSMAKHPTTKADKRIPRIVEETGTSILTVPLTDADRAAIDEMAGAIGMTAVNVVRLALWHYGHHLGLDLPVHIFGVRRDTTH